MQFLAYKKDGKLVIETPTKYAKYLSEFKDGTKFIIDLEKKTSKRTGTQNNALHKFFELLSNELNGAGYTIPFVLKFFSVELDWDTNRVKQILWKPLQKALLKKKSTTELTKQGEIDKVYDHLNRSLGEKLHIHVPFPIDEQRQKEKQYLGAPEVKNYPSGHTPTAFED